MGRKSMSMTFVSCNDKSTKDTFSFTFTIDPSLRFCFDSPVTVPVPANRPFKRRRALSDVDGGGSEGRKKRRLRLHLITSRLSRPFSQPATNIVNRGISKTAVWGKKKVLSKNLLRKAAIMNRVRLRLSREKEIMLQQQQERRERLALSEIPGTLVAKPPWRYEIHLPPSPLGLSNYDALDLEDGLFDEEDNEDGSERDTTIYSDFNFMNPTTEGDGYDFLDALDGISPGDLPDTPPPPLEEDSIAEILREEERQGDSVFVRVEG